MQWRISSTEKQFKEKTEKKKKIENNFLRHILNAKQY